MKKLIYSEKSNSPPERSAWCFRGHRTKIDILCSLHGSSKNTWEANFEVLVALTLQAFRVRWGAKHSPLTSFQILSPGQSDIHNLVPSILQLMWSHTFWNQTLVVNKKCIFFLQPFEYTEPSDFSFECLKFQNLTPRSRTTRRAPLNPKTKESASHHNRSGLRILSSKFFKNSQDAAFFWICMTQLLIRPPVCCGCLMCLN